MAIEMSPAQGALHTSRAARARTKKRYRAQSLLKFLGLAAIGFAALALSSLLYSIVSRAIPALNETYITLDVHLDQAGIDPQGKSGPDILYKAGYSKLIRKSLKKKFPGLARAEKRKLYALVSDTANYELRDHIVANPSLVGKTVSFDLLADDDVDLFIKGRLGAITRFDAIGPARPVGGHEFNQDITVHIEPESLRAGLEMIKAALGKQADVLEPQARAQQRAIQNMQARLAQKNSDDGDEKILARKNLYEEKYRDLTNQITNLRKHATQAGGREILNPTLPSLFLKINGGMIKVNEIAPDQVRGKVALPLRDLRGAQPGSWSFMAVATPEDNRKISDKQIIWLEHLKSQGRVKQTLNWHFLTSADASEPEEAGISGGLMGTFWTMLVTFLLSFPTGVMAALYLEEFAPKNAITRFVEVNINNLAAVPSIVFGLLGLAIFINYFGLPYSSSLVGGIVLALMTLPTVIIASRASIRAVPPSIREAALGIGASKMQTVFQHILPLAMPGIMTGSIIGMAQALGETAPLLMIGMVAFIVDPPMAVTDSAASLPVLIYLWADRAELAFDMRTASAILVLLTFLVLMNGFAILLRKRFERRW